LRRAHAQQEGGDRALAQIGLGERQVAGDGRQCGKHQVGRHRPHHQAEGDEGDEFQRTHGRRRGHRGVGGQIPGARFHELQDRAAGTPEPDFIEP
jgi:hypothetical protein